MINYKTVLAIVIARKNSIGFPGKNYKPLMGLPCFLWSVKAAEKSKYVDRIVVSSCCPYVKKSWKEYDKSSFSTFINRPEELNGPSIKNEDVLRHAIVECQDSLNFTADLIVTLQPTSPIRYDNLLDRCIEKMEQEDSDSLVTVTPNYPFIWNDYGSEVVCPNMYYLDRPMREDIKDSSFSLIDNGNIYITKYNILIQNNNRLGGKISVYKTDKYQSYQIDTREDFEIVESIGKVYGIV